MFIKRRDNYRLSKITFHDVVFGVLALGAFVGVAGTIFGIAYEAAPERRRIKAEQEAAFSRACTRSFKRVAGDEMNAYPTIVDEWCEFTYPIKTGLTKTIWCDIDRCTETMPRELYPKPQNNTGGLQPVMLPDGTIQYGIGLGQ